MTMTQRSEVRPGHRSVLEPVSGEYTAALVAAVRDLFVGVECDCSGRVGLSSTDAETGAGVGADAKNL